MPWVFRLIMSCTVQPFALSRWPTKENRKPRFLPEASWRDDIQIQQDTNQFGSYWFWALAVGLLGQNKEKKYSKHDPCSAEMSAQRIEAAIRERIRKPEGEITQADYHRITYLPLTGMGLTDIALLAKLFFPPTLRNSLGFDS